ncbi:MAG: amidohydrolase family protein, partial [Gemmatimonadota bacterium]
APALAVAAAFAAAALVTTAAPLTAQQASADPDDWDVTEPVDVGSEVDFTTDEGTWMSVDVSPDGSEIVFDLLGDIYIMPIEGGRARALTRSHSLDVQPRFSPDGRRIAFVSDRDGLDNIWVMDRDGSNPRQVTHEGERQVNQPVWTPDGEYIVARKHYRNTRSLGAGEMWMWHVDGGGSGLRITERPNWEQNSGDPEISPDGRHLYYTEDVSPGGGFQYNRDPHGVVYALFRVDLETGERERFLSAPGGQVRPRVSPDGETLAFVRRIDDRSVLMLHDIESGRERALWDGLDHDQQEIWAIFGLYPSFDWTPDGESIVVWAGGRINRVSVDDGAVTEIPFEARIRHRITEAVRFPVEVHPDEFDVRMLRWATVSPGGDRVVYSALGRLWVKDLPDGEPRRVTSQTEHWELYPSWAPDGRTIVYATWDDEELGAIRTVDADGGNARVVHDSPGHYVEPSFSPDGSEIVFRRIGGDGLRGRLWTRETGVYRVAAPGSDVSGDDAEPVLVTEGGTSPRWDHTGERIYLNGFDGGSRTLFSVDRNGGDRVVHMESRWASEFVPAPDGRSVAVLERYRMYIAPLPATGRTVTFSPGTRAYPVQRLDDDSGFNLHWAPDGGAIHWTLGPTLHVQELERPFAFAADAEGDGDEAALVPPREIPIGFDHPSDRPSGAVALVGAQIVTMRGDEVIEDGTVVVRDNRIAAVGPRTTVDVPDDARVIDVAGNTIIPGLIDAHAHGSNGSAGITPETHWGYLTNLAFGVTTLHNPSSGTEMVFTNAEMIRAGELVGPRLYSTGTILYGGETGSRAEVDDYDDAVAHLRRMREVGAISVKSYIQPRRDSRQMLVRAAREAGLMIVPEGSATYFWNLTQILDGHTGIEHNIPVAPLYRDVLELYAASESGYTPTLVVNFGGPSGERWFYAREPIHDHERLLSFVPREVVVPNARRREIAPPEDYQHIRVAESAKDLVDRGVTVQIGAHGQMQGIAAHWELWMLEQGGMTPHEALRSATLHGARYLGMDDDLGSIEPGKLADLVVLERDPLADLRASEDVRYTMINGRLFDARTMNQLWPTERERGSLPWER